MSSTSNGVSRRSLMTATALASLAAMTGCGGGSSAAAPVPGSPPPPPPPAPVTSKFLYTANSGTPDSIGSFSITASTGFLGTVPGPIGVGADPVWIAAHPTGKFIFVAGDADLRSYVVNQTTGGLTLADFKSITTQAGTFPTVEVHPDGSVVYVNNTSSGQIDTYSVNLSTGVLTQVFGGSGSSLPSGTTLYLKVHPNGKFLYASDDSTQISVFPILTGGQLFDNGFIPDSYSATTAEQMNFNTTGTVLYTSNGTVFAAYPCDPTTGVIDTTVTGPTYLKPQPSANKPSRNVLHPNNRFIYGTDGADISMINVDATGTFGTFVAPGFVTTTGNTVPTALAIDYTGKYLYATLGTTDSVDVFSISSTGALTLLNNVSTGDSPQAIAIASFS